MPDVTPLPLAGQPAPPRPPHPFFAFWAAFRDNRGALLGLFVVAAVVVLALLADVVAPHLPTEQFQIGRAHV